MKALTKLLYALLLTSFAVISIAIVAALCVAIFALTLYVADYYGASTWMIVGFYLVFIIFVVCLSAANDIVNK